MGYDNFARLSERDKARVGKILRGAFIVSFCLCFFAACHLVIQIWHWPGWLAYVGTPMLGAYFGSV